MPTYEYECPECGHKFEKFHSMTDKPVKICPACKENKVKRLIGLGGGVLFKGSGFYTTEYRSSEYKKQEKQEKTTATASPPEKSSSSPCSTCKAAACPAAAKK